MEDSENELTFQFEADSEYSVSLETATSLMTIVGAPSLEALIQHSLALLRDHLEIAYPKEAEEISTSEHWCNIARQLPNGINVGVISGFINRNTQNNAQVSNEYSLQELMSDVTDENKHEHIDFGKPIGKDMP
ncbi:AbrB/MazE/SpoVT family DNA-binding domain-containing protein [Methylophilus medardicus]|uniref:Uncharacterized protein n=1 Tax=Methylophilus medardicus TaxID=2588534 RepID=A0A5B8CTZ7_9PROT|nr:hypothetical protein [Methylophilus medardicus]QDC44762.1 hypothetical protein FIU01_09675 [Methylophilus medardicus]QDC49769.1 hypothetical protein FIU00_09675 [Methylophilus medardicus]QDC53474.1 hypothetical protein FIT99_09675 [Methylophilus medardicus]